MPKELIGNNKIHLEINRICNRANMYNNGYVKLPNYLICLNKGCGRTSVVRNISEKLTENKVINFTNGIDDFIEIELDGSLEQYENSLIDAMSAARYGNAYRGIVAIDAMKLVQHQLEPQFFNFIPDIKKLFDEAMLIFFAPQNPSNSEIRFIDELTKQFNLKHLYCDYSTTEEYASMIMSMIHDKDIIFNDKKAVHETLCNILNETGIKSIHEAEAMAEELAFCADFNKRPPVISTLFTVKITDNNKIRRENYNNAE